MARLFLHLGPPKTATTTLQSAFSQLRSDHINYGGVSQPRSAKPELSAALHSLTKSNLPSHAWAAALARQDIAAHLDAGQNVLVSEEMFLVPQQGATAAQKLTRLGAATAGLSRVAVLTLRRPSDGLASLFQEVSAGLGYLESRIYRRFVASSFARAFHYPALIGDLRSAGFDRLFLLDFDRLDASVTALGAAMGDGQAFVGIALDHLNRSTAGLDTGYRHQRRVSVGEHLVANPANWTVRAKRFLRACPAPLGSRISRITLRRVRSVSVRQTDAERARLDTAYETLRPHCGRLLLLEDLPF